MSTRPIFRVGVATLVLGWTSSLVACGGGSTAESTGKPTTAQPAAENTDTAAAEQNLASGDASTASDPSAAIPDEPDCLADPDRISSLGVGSGSAVGVGDGQGNVLVVAGPDDALRDGLIDVFPAGQSSSIEVTLAADHPVTAWHPIKAHDGFVLLGSIDQSSSLDPDVVGLVVRLSADGEVLWQRTAATDSASMVSINSDYVFERENSIDETARTVWTLNTGERVKDPRPVADAKPAVLIGRPDIAYTTGDERADDSFSLLDLNGKTIASLPNSYDTGTYVTKAWMTEVHSKQGVHELKAKSLEGKRAWSRKVRGDSIAACGNYLYVLAGDRLHILDQNAQGQDVGSSQINVTGTGRFAQSFFGPEALLVGDNNGLLLVNSFYD